MPCTYWESENEIRDRQAAELKNAVEKETKKLRAELDAATNAACVLSKIVEASSLMVKDKGVVKWIKEHKVRDQKREGSK